MSNFDLWKKQALSKLDKSNIGSIDERVQILCNIINQRNDMFTLSSCSGRITLQKNTNYKKIENIWEFVSHDEVSFEEISEVIINSKNDLVFLEESVILHICVKDLELARELMHIAKSCSFNQVGIIACKTKIVVELICDVRLEVPLFNQEIKLSSQYIKKLVQRANLNLNKSWESINKLEKKLK